MGIKILKRSLGGAIVQLVLRTTVLRTPSTQRCPLHQKFPHTGRDGLQHSFLPLHQYTRARAHAPWSKSAPPGVTQTQRSVIHPVLPLLCFVFLFPLLYWCLVEGNGWWSQSPQALGAAPSVTCWVTSSTNPTPPVPVSAKGRKQSSPRAVPARTA